MVRKARTAVYQVLPGTLPGTWCTVVVVAPKHLSGASGIITMVTKQVCPSRGFSGKSIVQRHNTQSLLQLLLLVLLLLLLLLVFLLLLLFLIVLMLMLRYSSRWAYMRPR